MRILAAAATDVGRVREGNEDAFLVSEDLALFAVADGMGGHEGGEIASATAVEALRAAVAGGRPIDEAIRIANRAVHEKARASDALHGMGTTMTAVVALGDSTLLVGHVGDSRAYLLRGGALRRLTEDHSLVEELVRAGQLTPEQAEAHPQRAIITRALGIEPEVEVDLYTVDVLAGDRVVLCSDGLTTMVREREVERVVRTESDLRLAADRLVDAANAGGGEDNVTVVVLDVTEVDAPTGIADLATGTATDAPGAPAPTPPAEAGTPRRSAGRRLRAALLVVVPLLVIGAVVMATVGWYARNTYYVGSQGGVVVVFRGRPGGVLGWDPTVERRTELRLARLPPVEQRRIAAESVEGSRDRVDRYVAGLEAQAVTTAPPTTRPAPTVAPLTIAPPTTVPPTTTRRPRPNSRRPSGPTSVAP